MLTEIEKRVIAAIQGNIEVTSRPYRQIAKSLDIPEERLLEILQKLCARGVIRRFGATIRHQKSGFTANAMVAWQVEEDRIETVGKIMASFRQVSHCYRRNPTGDWPYNLYTMIHGPQNGRKIGSRRLRSAVQPPRTQEDLDAILPEPR
jgi:DNA-binding Lrp family transcriptional regulator